MRIIVISDLHLGVKNDISNNFKLDEYLFNNFLQHMLNKYDTIVLNGDVFELWEDIFETYGSSMEMRIRNRVNNILNSWIFGNLIRDHPRIIVLSGNHDVYIKKYNMLLNKNVRDKLEISSNGYNILIMHGHFGDILCNDKSCCSSFICCCSQTKSTLEDLLNTNLDNGVDKIVATFETSDKKITKYAQDILKASNYNAIIFGHTHRKCMVKIKNKVYVNDGCVVSKTDSIDLCVITIDNDKMTIDNINLNINNLNRYNSFDRATFINGKLM